MRPSELPPLRERLSCHEESEPELPGPDLVLRKKYRRYRSLRKAISEDLRAWTPDELEMEAMRYALDGTSPIMDGYQAAEEEVHFAVDQLIDSMSGFFRANEPEMFAAHQKLLFDLLGQYWFRVNHVASKGMTLRLSGQSQRIADELVRSRLAEMVDLLRAFAQADEDKLGALAARLSHEVRGALVASSEVQEQLVAQLDSTLSERDVRSLKSRLGAGLFTNVVVAGAVNIASSLLAQRLGLAP